MTFSPHPHPPLADFHSLLATLQLYGINHIPSIALPSFYDRTTVDAESTGRRDDVKINCLPHREQSLTPGAYYDCLCSAPIIN